jgi:type IV secretory pathway VirB4 component
VQTSQTHTAYLFRFFRCFRSLPHHAAIVGSSGAGKTTLLNMLAGRLDMTADSVSGGEILVNGKKRDYSTFRTRSGESRECH